VRALDADSGVNAELHYSILDHDVRDLIYINPRTGAIHATAGLNYETTKTLRFTVQAQDGGGGGWTGESVEGGSVGRQGAPVWLNDTTSVVITVLDVNDEEPTFNVESYQFHVSENRLAYLLAY